MTELPQADAERPDERLTLTDWVRGRAAGLVDPLARVLARRGVPANAVTVIGFLLQLGVAGLFGLGRMRLGGVVLAFVAPLDALDGAVAREVGSDGRFGAFLDSTLDRLSDAALLAGLAASQFQQGAEAETGLFLVALVAALLVSYARARAEALGVCCKVGLLTRLERVFFIAVLSALRLTTVLAWTLAVLSVVTFFQRVVHVYLVASRQR